MNELAWNYEYWIEEGGVFGRADLTAIIQKMNRMPYEFLNYRFSIEAMQDLLKRPS